MNSSCIFLNTSFVDRRGVKTCIRLLDQNDTQLIAEFFYDLSDREKKFFRPHPFDLNFAQKITKNILPTRHFRIVASVIINNKEKIVGYAFVTIEPITNQFGYFGIVVLNEYSNRGIGYALLSFTLSVAKKMGVKKIYLNVIKENRNAIHLYLRRGFKISTRPLIKSLLFEIDEGIYGFGIFGLLKNMIFSIRKKSPERKVVWMYYDFC